MARVPDQDHRASLRHVALPLAVNLRHQRAGGVEDAQPARSRIVFDDARDAVRAEHGDRPDGNLGQMLDESGALRAEAFDDVPVVNDLVTHVHRRAEALERLLDDVDRADDARAEASRLRKHHAHGSDCVGEGGGTKAYICFSR